MYEKREQAGQANAGGGGSGHATGGGRVQLKQGLRGAPGGYDQQVQMLSPNGAQTSGGGGDTADEKEGAPKNAMIVLSARAGGDPFTSDFWQNLNVGHAWVDVRKPDGKADSWGFTVKDYQNFPRTQPWKTVEGMVLHPDGSSGASGTLAEPITEAQLEQGEKWAEAQRGQPYNLFNRGGLNCASFSTGMFEAATGKKAPSSMFGAMIANPTSLSAAVNTEVERRQKEEAERGGGEVTEPGVDPTKENV